MTKKQSIALALGFGLLVGVSANGAADDPVYTDIKKQADLVGKKAWDELSKDGATLSKKHVLQDVMIAFRPRKYKTPGIGVGATPGLIDPDGIEAKIINISKRPMAPTALEKESKELIRMAEITAAIASVSTHQWPGKPLPEKNATEQDWVRWSRQMHDNSQELIKAIKDKKPLDVKNAAFKLNDTCAQCHAATKKS